MEISEEKLFERDEMHYNQGRRMLLLSQLNDTIRELYGETDLSKERVMAELEASRLALRSICKYYGDNDWDDDLYLPDVINKHLGNYLYENKKNETKRD